MADEPNPDIENDDELLLDTPIPPEDEDAPLEGDEIEGDEETVLTFGDEPLEPDEPETPTIKHMRAEINRVLKENADLKRAQAAPKDEPVQVGEKPTIEDCEFDEEKYDAAMDAWKARKAKADAHVTTADDQVKQQWAGAFQRYNEGKAELAKLGVADVEAAQAIVEGALDNAQQGSLVMAADDPAKVMVALAKNPTKLAELAGETNPLRFAATIARLEGTLKVVKRRKAPEPDEPVRGSGRISRESGDKKLAKLEAEADKSGDRSKVIAYKRELRQAAQKD